MLTINPTIAATVAVAFVGFAAFWANPHRSMNRAFFTVALHVSGWLLCVNIAVASSNGLFWYRLSCAIGGCFPLHMWIVQQSITARLGGSGSNWVRQNWKWVIGSLLLTLIPFTDLFIPSLSTPEARQREWGYYGYYAACISLYVFLITDAYKGIKTLTGVRKLELQVWLGGGALIAVAVLALMGMTEITPAKVFIRLQSVIILLFYAGMAVAITTHRIFDARQILVFILEKTTLVMAVSGVAFLLDWALVQVLPQPFDFLVTTAFALWFAVTFNGWLDSVFHFYPEATVARQAAFDVARRETGVENLEKAFLKVLQGWGHCHHAFIAAGTGNSLRSANIEITNDGLVTTALKQLRWATPERLLRERSTAGREAVSQFLAEQHLGALVVSEGPSLTALVGVGVAASRRPFTYPQITQLLELASIVSSALERAHFSVKAQHAEQLATVGLLGASVAHEIRNPLVSIKTFVQHLPQHYHDAAFRDKFFKLIGSEVSRIDQLTEQLLDLASPRAYAPEILELHPILHTTLELVAAKAADKRVELRTEFQANPDQIFTDMSATKQVILNLCFNAIQAVELHDGERWVSVSTRKVQKGVEMAIEDSGPGIAPEIRAKLFQPFQTTKSSGFGLGLAICGNILNSLNATITVDPRAPGKGAMFRIIFPCQAL